MTDVTTKMTELYTIAILMVAWKFEGGYAPGLNECTKFSLHDFSTKDVRDAEVFVLKTLNFRFMAPTSWKFLWLYESTGILSFCALDLAHHYLERCLLEHDMLV